MMRTSVMIQCLCHKAHYWYCVKLWVPYSGKFLRIQIFVKVSFFLPKKFSHFYFHVLLDRYWPHPFLFSSILRFPYSDWTFLDLSLQFLRKITNSSQVAMCIEACSPILACCEGVYLAYAPLDFKEGVRALFLTASLAALTITELTEGERCLVEEGGMSSAGSK